MPEVTEFGAALAAEPERAEQNPFLGLDDRQIHRLFAQWNRDVEIPEIEKASKGKLKGLGCPVRRCKARDDYKIRKGSR